MKSRKPPGFVLRCAGQADGTPFAAFPLTLTSNMVLSCVDGPIQTFTVGSQSHSFVSSTEFLPVEVQGPGGTTRPGEATFGERVGHEELHNANPDASEGQVQEMMDRLMPSGRRIRH